MTLGSEPLVDSGLLPTWREPRLIPMLMAAASAAPFTWWALGLVTEFNDSASPDYLLEPPDLSAGAELVIGLAATVVTLVGAVWLAQLIRSGRWSVRWLGVLGPIAAAFVYTGATYRTITAPVIGANIGGGMLILGAGPVALVLLVMLVGFARRPKR